MYKGLFFITLLFFNIIFCQEEPESFGINENVKVLNESISFYNYFSEFRLNNDLLLRTGLRERNTLDYSFLEIHMQTKYFVSEKFSVLMGPKLDIIKSNGTIESKSVSLFSTFGLQYDVTKEFSIEARANYMITKQSSSTIDNPILSPVIYRFGTRLKF